MTPTPQNALDALKVWASINALKGQFIPHEEDRQLAKHLETIVFALKQSSAEVVTVEEFALKTGLYDELVERIRQTFPNGFKIIRSEK